MRGRGLVIIGPQAFDGRAGFGAQEIAKFGAGLIEEKRLGNLVTCLPDRVPARGASHRRELKRFLAACGGERERRRNWGHPRPRQGTSPPAPPYVLAFGGSPCGWQVWGIGDHGFPPLFSCP